MSELLDEWLAVRSSDQDKREVASLRQQLLEKVVFDSLWSLGPIIHREVIYRAVVEYKVVDGKTEGNHLIFRESPDSRESTFHEVPELQQKHLKKGEQKLWDDVHYN